MARKRHSRKRGSRRYRGGSAGAPDPSTYSDAASYQLAVNGGMPDQWNRTFMGSGNTTSLVGLQGQKTGGGSRKKRRGGFLGLGGVISEAVVPLSILGMQQTYGKRNQGDFTRRRSRGSRRRRY